MDMKSFNMKICPEFIIVPYRPVSGSLAKDMKNTFMFTMDTLHITETGFKQHHPEIFPNPFVTVKVRGRGSKSDLQWSIDLQINGTFSDYVMMNFRFRTLKDQNLGRSSHSAGNSPLARAPPRTTRKRGET